MPIRAAPSPKRVGGESSPKDEFGNENSDEQYAMKLPKLVYHIMKDKPLRKLLSDAGLSAVGRRDQLIDRHKEFTLQRQRLHRLGAQA